MSAASLRVLFATAALCAVATGPVRGQAALFQDQTLSSIHPGGTDGFGGQVLMRGGRIFVGAPMADSVAQQAGEVQVFDYGTPPTFTGMLAARDLQTGDGFGSVLALSGNLVVVGAPGHDHGVSGAGAAYVFRLTSGIWIFDAELQASDRAVDDSFGCAVAISGNTILVGALTCDIGAAADQGAFYVFESNGSAWTETAKVVAGDGLAGDRFGYQLALDGDLAVASTSMQFTGGIGSVYAWRRAAGVWGQEAKFVPTSGGTFGRGLDVEGDVIAIGQPYIYSGGTIFVERRISGVWVEEAQFEMQNALSLDQVGTSIDLQGDRILAGAPGFSPYALFSGGAIVFERSAGVWSETLELRPTGTTPWSWVGGTVALDGDLAVVAGGYHDHVAFLFELLPLVGTMLCAGDGSGTACPCANESSPSGGLGCKNAYGIGAALGACGSTSIAADDLALSARCMVRGTPVMLACGDGTAGGGAGVLYGDGLFCLGGTLRRLGVQTTVNPAGFGTAIFGPGLAASGPFGPGDTRYFQAIYRDPQGPCGFRFNTTNALRVTFTP
jgi:hypothetical protein